MNNAEVLIKFKADDSQASSVEKEQEQKLKQLQKTGENVAIGLTAAVDGLVGAFVGMGVSYNAEIETYLTRLTTLTGSAKEAKDILEKIKQDALKTPFDVKSLVSGQSLLMSAGVEAGKARETILSLGDAIAASGGGNEEFQRMVVNLQQIKNVGKASALDMKQFAYAGIDMVGLLADYLGTTRDNITSDERTYENISGALAKASAEGGKYFQAMEAQSKTMKGATSNLQESWQVFAGTMSQEVFEAVKNLIPKLTEMFDWLAENKTLVTAIVLPLLTFINVLGGLFALKKIVGLVKAFNAALMANPIIAIVALIASLVVGFIYLWNNCEAFRQFWINLWENIKLAFNVAVEWIKNSLDQIIAFIQEIPAWISGIVNSIITFISKIPYYIGYVIGYILGKLFVFFRETIPNAIESFFAFLVSIPGRIWELIVSIFEFLGKIPDYLNDLWTKIRIWFINFKDKAIKGFSNLIDNIISFFKELPGKIYDIGKNVVEGLWNGVKDMKKWLTDKIFDFFKGIVDGAKDALGIHSPSKEFKILGKFSVLGYTEALDDMQNEVDTAIQDTFGISPQLQNASSLHYSPNVVVNNDINVSQDPLGQMVSNIKSFSGGAKNDYSFGLGE